MKQKCAFGTIDWVENVFGSPDARQVWGRSRPTQRYAVAGVDGKPIYAEGGNESTARGLMILGVNAGMIKRWKFQWFALTKAEHAVDAVPDLLFETSLGNLFVTEVRSARFQTAEKLSKARKIEKAINATGSLNYLYWTDAWPLTPTTTNLVRELRKCGTSNIPKASFEALSQILKDGPTTFFELRDQKCFRDVVLAAVWAGKAHIDLLSPVTDSTLVTLNCTTRRLHELLQLSAGGQTWWTSLEKA